MNRNHLIAQLADYKTSFHEEKLFASSFVDLMEKYSNCFERSLATGHITGSAWILNKELDKSLLVFHAKLDRWLQPGGHSDGDEDVQNVAYNELMEETGLKRARLYTEGIFDLDIHLIPANKDATEHHHFDIRYLFVADEKEPVQISHESRDVKWWNLWEIPELVNHDRSILRMVEKSQSISNILTSDSN